MLSRYVDCGASPKRRIAGLPRCRFCGPFRRPESGEHPPHHLRGDRTIGFTKPLHHALCVDRADPADHAQAEVLHYALDRRGGGGFQEPRAKLLPFDRPSLAQGFGIALAIGALEDEATARREKILEGRFCLFLRNFSSVT